MNSPDYLVITAAREGRVETWFIPKPAKVEIDTEELDVFGNPATPDEMVIETEPTAITLKDLPAAFRVRLKADMALGEPSMWTGVRDAKGKELGIVELTDRIADRLGRDREKVRSKVGALIASHLNEVWSHAVWTGREAEIADTRAWKARHQDLNESHTALLGELHTLEAFLQDEMGAHERDYPGTTTIERAITLLLRLRKIHDQAKEEKDRLASQADKTISSLMTEKHKLQDLLRSAQSRKAGMPPNAPKSPIVVAFEAASVQLSHEFAKMMKAAIAEARRQERDRG